MPKQRTTVLEHWRGPCGYCGDNAPLQLLDAGVRRSVGDLVRGTLTPRHHYRVECRACGNGPHLAVPASPDAAPSAAVPRPRASSARS